jgi:DNA (cytosine-5)-methyltransferase 1
MGLVLLDLFCGVGGAAMGYHQMGFDIIGVDIKPQPNYPFKFIQADALEFLREMNFYPDAVHASPPCQGYSSAIRSDGRWSKGVHKGKDTPKLIQPVRDILREMELTYVIENVEGAKDDLVKPLLLCGAMFGLGTRRHRLFESNAPIRSIAHDQPCWKLTHPVAEAWIAVDPEKRDRRIYRVVGKGRQTGTVDVWRALMEIPWAQRDLELAEAIPPAYTRYIGSELLRIGV